MRMIHQRLHLEEVMLKVAIRPEVVSILFVLMRLQVLEGDLMKTLEARSGGQESLCLMNSLVRDLPPPFSMVFKSSSVRVIVIGTE